MTESLLPYSTQHEARRAVARRIASVIAIFFTAASCMLQWFLSHEQEMLGTITRQFMRLEAALCTVIAVSAVLYLAYLLVRGLADSHADKMAGWGRTQG